MDSVAMTVDEMKNELSGRTYPEKVRISVDQVVVDIPTFLNVSFIEVENWKKDIHKCPAWGRLLKFRNAVISP